MKFNWIILLCFITLCANAQKEDHSWYFSSTYKGFFFDFNTNSISVTSNHAPLSYEGCGVAADPTTGNILFYSDGITVFDKNNIPMSNGSGLLGDITCTTNGIPCPVPGIINKYYLFYNSANSPNAGTIYYSIIDMSLPGNGTISLPLGDIVSTQKNIQVATSTSEGFSIIPNPNGAFWLLSTQNNSNIIRIYSITSIGVALVSSFTTPYSISDSRGLRYCKINHKIAITNMIESQGCFIVDFNPTSGTLSNFIQIPGSILGSSTNNIAGFYDSEWSPDGTKLYLSKYRMTNNGGRLYQYDLNFPSSPIALIYSLSGGFDYRASGLKLAPDGKIYFLYKNSIYSDSRYIGAINNPNIAGSGCNFIENVLYMGTSYPETGKFPEFLVPACQFNISFSDTTTDFVCRPNDTTHTNIPLSSIVNNPCNDSLDYHIISVTYGTAHVVGNNIQYVQPNFYTTEDTIVIVACNTGGQCDTSETIIHLNYVGPVSPVITCVNDTLYSSSSANNQWLLNGNPITGAIGSFYVPTQTGYYSIKINVGLCYAESAPFYYEWHFVFENNLNNHSLEVFPNPAKTILYINGFSSEEVQISDALGKNILEIKNNGKIDISALSKGIYFIEIIKGKNIYSTKFIKE